MKPGQMYITPKIWDDNILNEHTKTKIREAVEIHDIINFQDLRGIFRIIIKDQYNNIQII